MSTPSTEFDPIFIIGIFPFLLLMAVSYSMYRLGTIEYLTRVVFIVSVFINTVFLFGNPAEPLGSRAYRLHLRNNVWYSKIPNAVLNFIFNPFERLLDVFFGKSMLSGIDHCEKSYLTFDDYWKMLK